MFRLYLKLIGARIRAQMQYKVSFVFELFGFALLTVVDFVVLVFLLQRFQSVAGWSVQEVALLYGLSAIAFSFAEMIFRGFDAPFSQMMRTGSFDGVLSRPLGAFFQVLASEFQLRRLGRTFQGALVLGYALAQLPIEWTPAKLALLPVTVLSGTLIYGAVTVIAATVCFWTIQPPEVIHVFTSGGQYMSSYPLSIYHRWVRAVFLFVVPVAFANYPATIAILGRTDPAGLPAAAAWASPLVAGAFFAAALAFWRVGVGKYQSTGS